MAEETRIERWLDRELARATRPGQAAVIIATVTIVITLVSGFLMTVVDQKNFPSIGGGLWWAIQTVTTVGYGDEVPTNSAGKLVAAVVMLGGIGFLTVITAAITSGFVTRSRKEPSGEPAKADSAALAEIVERLDRIETALSKRT